MPGCSTRRLLLSVCTLQMVVVIECQVFDFMGYMYGPILANFFHIIFIILGIFGTLQFHPKYIIAYTSWNVIWVGWCIFVMCFYLDAGVLSKDSDILSLGTGSRSWWEVNGPGCVPDFTSPPNSSLPGDPDPSRPPRPSRVDGCWLQYHFVETIQSVIQCFLSVVGILGGLVLSKAYMEEDDGSSFKWVGAVGPGIPPDRKDYTPLHMRAPYNELPSTPPLNKKATGRHSLYGGSMNAQGPAVSQVNGYGVQAVSPRPMTPRRVKRRSVQARDSGLHTLSRASQRRSARSRSSQRRRSHQNPVTRLMDQQNRFLDSSFEESRPRAGYTNPVFQPGSNSDINQSGIEDFYRPHSARSSYSNYHASRPISYLHNNEVFSNQAVAQVPIKTNRNHTLNKSAAVPRVRADLPRGASSFLAQGPPAYREGADSETAI